MNEQAPYEDQPGRMPYGPQPPSRAERMWMALKYYSFPVTVLLLIAGLAAALYWMPDPSSTTLSEEEIQAAIESHQSSRRAPSSSTPASGTTATAEEQSALGNGYGTVSVRSRPSEATVRVDGDSVGATPLYAYPLKSGVYFVSVEKEGFFSTDTLLILRNNESPSFSMRLRERSAVDEASSASRSSAARSPVATDDTPSRSAEGSSSSSEASNQRQVLPPEEPPEQSASEEEQEPTAEDEEPETPEIGSLQLVTTPDQARVVLDGTPVGTTPLTLDAVLAGAHRVTLYRSGYDTLTVDVEVRPGEQHVVERALTQQRGQLRILAQPWGSIYVDGELHERNADVWYETSVPVGTHQTTAVHPALGRRTQTVTVTADQTQSVVIDLRADTSDPSADPDTTEQGEPPEENGGS